MRIIAAIALVVILAACQTTQGTQQAPTYSGNIFPIVAPILVEVRDTPRSATVQIQRTQMTNGLRAANAEIVLRGAYQVEMDPSGGTIISSIDSATKNGKVRNEDIILTAKISPHGRISDVAVDTETTNWSDTDQERAMLEMMVVMMPAFPSIGFSANHSDTAAVRIDRTNLIYSQRTLGITTWRGRDAIVFDMSIKEDGNQLLVKGYQILDVCKGAWVWSEYVMDYRTTDGIAVSSYIRTEIDVSRW